MVKISKNTVSHMASIAKIPITKEEEDKLADGFNKTLDVVNELFNVDVLGVSPTYQVTGLKNVLREDKVDESKMLSQKDALSNAPKKHEGYFVVDQILADD